MTKPIVSATRVCGSEPPPVPGARKSTCNRCGYPVWVAPSTDELRRRGKVSEETWCAPCCVAGMSQVDS